MAVGVEVLKDGMSGSRTSHAWLPAVREGAHAAGLDVARSVAYVGKERWLTLFGVGDHRYDAACKAHTAKGLPVACWDLGYVGKSQQKDISYVRVSLNGPHPTHADLDRTVPDGSRWEKLGVGLRECFDPSGHVVVVGMGRKSHAYIGEHDWEAKKLQEAKARFPGHRIIYRPKLNKKEDHDTAVDWPDKAEGMSIEQVLEGASLVICRHSNVAIDACISGVPVECEAGAAHWLYSKTKTPTVAQRLDFLYRMAWWQYQMNKQDMEQAWKFLLKAYV